jgi:hypothetical protein
MFILATGLLSMHGAGSFFFRLRLCATSVNCMRPPA